MGPAGDRRPPEVHAEAADPSEGQRPQGFARRARERLVRFWDSSAVVPLVLAEVATNRVRGWLREDPGVVVWTFTRVEVLSALARRRRTDPSVGRQLSTARREFLDAWPRWFEVTTVDAVKRLAERLVETHPLRAADALQIGAALVAADSEPDALEFVTLDARQAEAAEREGLRVVHI
ncbi:MAG: PIN domain-containing protein [Candidatus Rokuibacteriota bacterium]|nr:MAG: PIN domain-containing protein [Candidatus Rokubacteria bacterium]